MSAGPTKAESLLGGIRGVAEVGLDGDVPREDLLGLLLLDRGNDDHVLSRLPVHGRGDSVLGGELQGGQDALDFVEVATSGGGVGQGELELLVGADDEDASHGEGVVGVRVDHAVQV